MRIEEGSLMTHLDQLAEQALKLEPSDRAYLADLLEQSLPASGFADVEVGDAWSREIDRRVAAYDRGETQAISVEASLQHAREALARRRNELGGS